VVAADGSGDFTGVQAAVDAAPSGNAEQFVIAIRPGIYGGQVIVPADKPFITLRGLGRAPSDVVIVGDRANGSTDITNPHGFLFTLCLFTGDAPAGTVFLGRPWHPSNDPNAIAQTVIRNSWLGPHIVPATPWTTSAPSPGDARYFEFRTFGPGAVDSPDRPQLPADQARDVTPDDYLAGTDGWHPGFVW
jgi:pectin methylesterase-like acyl-CoA thioesterase